MKEGFKIKTMGFGELAQLYNPKINPASAANMLRRWIHANPALKLDLKNSGYKKYAKILTPKQVLAIVKVIGPP